ncbi:MAG: CHAT domain-containing protein [Terriglobia bacterium]
MLPFDSLRNGRGRYVLESHIVTYVPSATVLYLLRRTQRDHPTTARLLAVGGVPYERAPSILPVKVTDNTPGQASASGDFLGPAGLRLSNLPGTQQEVLNSAELLGGQHTLLLGKDATEAAFKSQRLADFSVIHLAVHGIASTQFPDRAALVLGSAPSSGEDGLLQVREIRDLPLDADLVTLSACDTGEGKLLGEEGIASLERAFLLAGAKAVIASLWTAEDACTTLLMKRLYWHLADGEDKGSALRQAKLDLLKEFGEETVPFYWAGFTLVGEGSTALTQPASIPGSRLPLKNASYANQSRTSAKWKISASTR